MDNNKNEINKSRRSFFSGFLNLKKEKVKMLTADGKLVEVIELKDHPFFIASQFHPEFQSKPDAPHPLFRGFIAAAHRHIHQRPL